MEIEDAPGASRVGLGFGGDAAADRSGAAAMEAGGAGASRDDDALTGDDLEGVGAAEAGASGRCARFLWVAIEVADGPGTGMMDAMAGEDMVSRIT